MASFFHLFIVAKPGVDAAQIQTKLNLSLDWFRYHTTSYVVYSSARINVLQGRFLPLVQPDGALFISKFSDPGERQGWMSQQFWDWFNSAPLRSQRRDDDDEPQGLFSSLANYGKGMTPQSPLSTLTTPRTSLGGLLREKLGAEEEERGPGLGSAVKPTPSNKK